MHPSGEQTGKQGVRHRLKRRERKIDSLRGDQIKKAMHPWPWYRERGGGTHEAGWRDGDKAKRRKERTGSKGMRIEVGQRPKTTIGGGNEKS